MKRNYQEFVCDGCGDLFYAEWKRLCTLCDKHVEQRAKALATLQAIDEAEARRVERALNRAIAKEGKSSMWEGHKE